ncbi:hypothetical protein CS542_10540 [Pedobacter sp. IW39]|nr:hypothetical protein CS542_10540 [Pedobacter sp. IW39]
MILLPDRQILSSSSLKRRCSSVLYLCDQTKNNLSFLYQDSYYCCCFKVFDLLITFKTGYL